LNTLAIDTLNFELQTDPKRVQQQIDTLAAMTEAEPPGVTRVLFSEADVRARAFIKKLCIELNLSLREDGIGNLFARWIGQDQTLPPIATGSHIDAIPNAGRYDGVVGVLGALEAFRMLKEAGFEPARSLELILFTAEEPTRFGIGCLGSRMLAGTLTSERLVALRDRDGFGLEHWRAQVGYSSMSADSLASSVKLAKGCYAGFLELHIEQGAVLERENVPIGVVEKIAAPSTLRVQLTGEGGHAGAVLMPGRRDALLAGAEISLAVESAAKTSGSPDTVGTTGVFRIEPGAVNSIPSRAWLEIDLRDTQVQSRDTALERIENAAREIASRRGIQLKMERVNVDQPAICDPSLVQTALETCRDLGLLGKRMISRAYHDSLFMASICPAAMIFIPCRRGVSHRPDEYSSPQQIAAGVKVLAHCLRKLAGR
jgi:N-carbamoyl-L-amino-acid hydrolase